MPKKSAFDNLSPEDKKIVWHANDMLWLWRDLNQRDTDGRGWFERTARQAYHDCLLSLKRLGLIEDYDCTEVRTKIKGAWHSDRRPLHFVQTGPEVDVS